MEEIYKNILLLVHSATQLSGISGIFNEEPTDENGEKLIQIVDKCENNFLKVKEEIVKMAQEAGEREKEKEKEDIQEIQAIKTKEGFLIKEQ